MTQCSKSLLLEILHNRIVYMGEYLWLHIWLHIMKSYIWLDIMKSKEANFA